MWHHRATAFIDDYVPRLTTDLPAWEPLQVRRILRTCADQGLLSLQPSRSVAPLDLDPVASSIVGRVFGRVPSFAWLHAIQSCMGVNTLFSLAAANRKQPLLRQVALGERVVGFALREPQAQSRAFATRATRASDAWILNGMLEWVDGAVGADLLIVRAEMGERRLGIFAVDVDTPGLEIGNAAARVGLGGVSTHPVSLEGVSLPDNRLLIRTTSPHQKLSRMLDLSRLRIASIAGGVTAESIRLAALQGRQSGDEQGKGRLIALSLEKWISDSVTQHAASLLSRLMARSQKPRDPRAFGSVDDVALEIVVAKVWATELATEASQWFIDTLGMRGVSPNFPAEGLHRDALALSVSITSNGEDSRRITRLITSRALAGAGNERVRAEEQIHTAASEPTELAKLRIGALHVGQFIRLVCERLRGFQHESEVHPEANAMIAALGSMLIGLQGALGRGSDAAQARIEADFEFLEQVGRALEPRVSKFGRDMIAMLGDPDGSLSSLLDAARFALTRASHPVSY